MYKPTKLSAGIFFISIALAIIALLILLKADHATGQPVVRQSSSLNVIQADGTTLGTPSDTGGLGAPQTSGLQPSTSNQTLQNTGAIK